jgi:transcriptional regulator with XRE-family HTH domain
VQSLSCTNSRQFLGNSDLCGLDRTYVGGIERGERNVALINIEKLARALKISLSELFRGVQNP